MSGVRSRFLLLGVAFCVALAVPACGKKGGARKAPAAEPQATLPPIDISRDRALLFTYRDGRAFRTVERLDDVPAGARGWVRVQDPSQPVSGADLVYVADLRKADAKGKFAYRVLPRSVFLAGRALPGGAGGGDAMGPRPSPLGTVILYSRPGCSACEAARIYLKQRRIPFVEKNVQADPAAARELAEKARKKGVPSNVVPILDVNGELVVGLDTDKLERLLRSQI